MEKPMDTIQTPEDLYANLMTIENYLTSSNKDVVSFAESLIKNGTCFIAYELDNEIRFAPSRFIGYLSNSLEKHNSNSTKHGSITNNAIQTLLGIEKKSKKLEKQYIEFCSSIGIKANATGSFGHSRKYWNLNSKTDDSLETPTLNEGFIEGKLSERIHRVRERNKKVVQFAKKQFISENGRLFCEVCEFDFKKTYGGIGEDFIEAHHTIPVSEMPLSHETKISDLALVCSNCHRMIHQKTPPFTVEELKGKIKNASLNQNLLNNQIS